MRPKNVADNIVRVVCVPFCMLFELYDVLCCVVCCELFVMRVVPIVRVCTCAPSYAAQVAAKAAMTTTISAASACITTTFLARITSVNLKPTTPKLKTVNANRRTTQTLIPSFVIQGHYDVSMGLNGILAGLVSITANCSVVDP